MKRASAFLWMFLAINVHPQSIPVLDQTQTYWQSIVRVGGTDLASQTFTPHIDGLLARLELWAGRQSDLETNAFLVSIAETSNGFPSLVLATVSQTDFIPSVRAWYQYDFSPFNIALKAGALYAIVLSVPGAFYGVGVGGSLEDKYAHGVSYQRSGDGAWSTYERAADLMFQTFMIPDSAPPEIICPTNMIVDFTSRTGAVVHFVPTAVDDFDQHPIVTSVPPSDSFFSIGTTTVNCTATDASSNSASCNFTITVLGILGSKKSVQAGLIVLRDSVTRRIEGKRLTSAVDHLTKATDSSHWLDETHLEPTSGRRVFVSDKNVIRDLKRVIRDHGSTEPDPVLFTSISRLVQQDRLLAEIAVDEAADAGANPKRISENLRMIARGNAAATNGHPNVAIIRYREAWRRATHWHMDR